MSNQSSLFSPPPNLENVLPDLRIGFILSPHFSLLPFACFIESLRHAADEADYSRQIYCHWRICSASTQPISASCGVAVSPDFLLQTSLPFDYLVVVGGLLPDSLAFNDITLNYIRSAYEANISVVGLCTGSFTLANAGLLDNRRCAVHLDHCQQFQKMFPSACPETDQVYINDNEVITCPGGTTALDLAFSLISERCGKARALKGLSALSVEKHRAASHRPNRPYGSLSVCGNWRVEQAVALMEKRLSTPLKMSELAQMLNTSERELNRSFNQHAGEAPSTVWRKIRLSYGHWLLVNTSKSIATIAADCGFCDASHFIRWFKNDYEETPHEFRVRRRSI